MTQTSSIATANLSRQQAEIDVLIAKSAAEISATSEARLVSTAPGSKLPAWWSVQDAMTISSVVLAFGLLTMLLAAWLLRVGRDNEALLRVFGTVIVLISALFLVVAGYSSEQIAPVMGLLGTIVGYLLGKNARADEGASTPK